MAIDWTYRAPQNDALDRFNAGFDQGTAIKQDREKRSALSAYLPAALKGDQEAIGKLAAHDPERATQLSERARNWFVQNSDYIGSALLGPDGRPTTDPATFERVKANAVARGADPKWLAGLKIEDAGALIQASTAAQESQYNRTRQLAGDQLQRDQFGETQRHNRAMEARAAAAAGNQFGPKLSPRDEKVMNDTGAQSDSASRIAAILRNVAPNFQAAGDAIGPGAGAQRTVAGVLSVIPGVTWLERQLSRDGTSQTQNVIDNYDAIDAASKELGIEALKGIGGSDTERELMTAIQTTISPNKSATENARIFKNQLIAADIVSQKGDLQAKWANAFGGLNRLSADGKSWQAFWSSYQKAAWADARKAPADTRPNFRDEQRRMLNQGNVPPGAPPPPPGTVVR